MAALDNTTRRTNRSRDRWEREIPRHSARRPGMMEPARMPAQVGGQGDADSDGSHLGWPQGMSAAVEDGLG
jgi:hypothetical protein